MVAGMAQVVNVMQERVEAEFHPYNLMMDLASFDIPTWDTAFNALETGYQEEGHGLLRRQKDRAWHLVQAHTGIVSLMPCLEQFCNAAKEIRNTSKTQPWP